MAWINLENLGWFNRNIRDWIKTVNIHANKIIQDSNNKFVTNEQINNWTNNKLDVNANAVSASKLVKPVRINGIEFDGSKDIEISIKESTVNIVELELPKNQKNITINNLSSLLSEDNKMWIFVDGIKLVHKKHYTINLGQNNIILNESYTSPVNVEVIFF